MPSITAVKRSRPDKNGQHPLQIRISEGQRSIRINLGHSVKSKEWDDVRKIVKSNHLNSKRLNNYINSKIVEVENLIFDLERMHDSVTLDMIKSKLKGASNSSTVFAQCDQYFDNLKMAGKFNRYSGERAVVNHLKRFRKHIDMNFEDMTVQFLERFKAYLLGSVNVSERSAMNYLLTIRTIFNLAIKEGLVSQKHYPFGKDKVRIKRPESEKIGLDESEVKMIESFQSEVRPYYNHARNVWLFSFYFAGMRASDVLCMKWENIKGDRLYYTMRKNIKSTSVKISNKAKVILEYYKETYPNNNHDLIFPDLSNVENFNDNIEVQKKLKYRIRKLDKALRAIRDDLELSKDVTMHIARHSFGNIAGDRIPIQRLQQLYRHSSITTTVNYQKAFLNRDTDKALDEVLNF